MIGLKPSFFLYGKIFFLLHVASSIFFYLGENVTAVDNFTWRRPPTNLTPDQIEALPYSYNGYGSSQDPDNSPWYRVFKQYLLRCASSKCITVRRNV